MQPFHWYINHDHRMIQRRANNLSRRGTYKFSVIALMRISCKCSFIFHKGTRYQVNRLGPMSPGDTAGDDLAVTYRATAVRCSERIDQRWRAIPEDSGCGGLKTHQSAIVTRLPLDSKKSHELDDYGEVDNCSNWRFIMITGATARTIVENNNRNCRYLSHMLCTSLGDPILDLH